MGGEHDHERVRVELAQLLQDGEAVAVGQFVVEQDEIDALVRLLDGLGRGARLDDFVAVLAQALCQRPSNQLFIVDNEDAARGHGP